jgi:hypothetical protein
MIAPPHWMGGWHGYIWARTIHDRPVEQHLQAATVQRILRPLITGAHATRFGVDFFPIQPDQDPFPGLETDGVELLGPDAEFIEFTDGIRLQVDADAERLEVAY